MIQFIDDHKNNYGVELICRVLPIAPSTYHRAKDLESYPEKRSLNVDKNNTEFVKLGKSVTVGLGYATQVGTIMNTAVGIMQTEQIGRIKKSFVGKSYSITAGDEFKITVGKSSLVMNADGSIIITGSTIITQAEKENKVIGKDVLINPPGASNRQVEEPAQIGADVVVN